MSRNRSREQVVLKSFSKHGSLDTYIHEWQAIRESRVLFNDDELEDQGQGIFADPDAIWLENAGFGRFVSQLQSGNGIEESNELEMRTSALPRTHAAVVRKRMNTLRSTIRSKQQNGEQSSHSTTSRTDVRNVFTTTASAVLVQKPVVTVQTTDTVTDSKPSPKSSPQASPGGSPSLSRHVRQTSSPSPVVTRITSEMEATRNGHSHHNNHHTQRSQSSEPRLVGTTSETSPSSLSHERTNSSSSTSGYSSGESHRSLSYSKHSPRHDISMSDSVLTRSSEVFKRPTPPRELRVGSSSNSTSTVESPMHRHSHDIKLHFGSQVSQAQSPNGSLTVDLPNFMIMPDALGITHVSDLSPVDLEKVRSLALCELTVTFEDHGIPLRPRRPVKLKNIPENSIFGVPLNVMLTNDRQREPTAIVPLFLEELLSHMEAHCLKDEGILRVPGHAVRVAGLQQDLESSFNAGGFSFNGIKTSDLSSILKQFVRDIPIPLLTREYLSAFASISDIEELKEQVRALNLLVLLLPPLNQIVLKRLVVFLEQVVQNSDSNKMDLTNVSMVIAPNLFVSLPMRANLDNVDTMACKTLHVVRLLIRYHKLLWTVPGEMLRQIRFLYDSEVKRLNQRAVQKALKQMQHQLMEQQPKIREVEHHIIRIKAPLFTRVCMAVDISEGVTAGDIVTKLQRRSRLNKDVVRKRFSTANLAGEGSPRAVSPSDDQPGSLEVVDAGEQFLFEIGGNIGERCLSNDTDMYSLFSVNPNAQWVIKPRDCPDLV